MKQAIYYVFAVISVVVTAGILSIAFGMTQYLPSFEPTEIYKFECPGRFRFKLTKSNRYTIWNYREFRTRLHLEKYANLVFQIRSPANGASVKIIPSPRPCILGPQGDYDDIHNFGVVANREFEFVAPETGLYILECKSNCIMAVAPYDELYAASTIDDHWINFHGSVNDFDFVKPTSLKERQLPAPP